MENLAIADELYSPLPIDDVGIPDLLVMVNSGFSKNFDKKICLISTGLKKKTKCALRIQSFPIQASQFEFSVKFDSVLYLQHCHPLLEGYNSSGMVHCELGLFYWKSGSVSKSCQNELNCFDVNYIIYVEALCS